jgi:hypothetical protein
VPSIPAPIPAAPLPAPIPAQPLNVNRVPPPPPSPSLQYRNVDGPTPEHEHAFNTCNLPLAVSAGASFLLLISIFLPWAQYGFAGYHATVAANYGGWWCALGALASIAVAFNGWKKSPYRPTIKKFGYIFIGLGAYCIFIILIRVLTLTYPNSSIAFGGIIAILASLLIIVSGIILLFD